MRSIVLFLLFFVQPAFSARYAAAVEPVAQRPGQWEPVKYPTPLRSFFFGSARFRPDPNYRWQPGQWVPVQPSPPVQWQPGPQELPR